MGKVLIYIAFIAALLGIGQAIVESDFGMKGVRDIGLFTLSTFVIVGAFILFIIGEFIERRRG